MKTDKNPHLKSSDDSSKIMIRLFIALVPIICFAIYKNGFLPYYFGYTSLFEAFYPVFIILVAIITSVLSEGMFIKFILKKQKEEFFSYMRDSYAIFPGLFLALIIPVNTPLILVFIGSFCATIIGKMLFGGFGYNLFNPALVGGIIILSSYSKWITDRGGYLNAMELDTIGGATPLSNLSNLNYSGTYDSIVSGFGDFYNFFFGTIPGSLGETSKFLIIIAFIFLVITKVIKFRIPLYYVSTVFVMTFLISYFNDFGIWYPFFHILSGGLLFGAVFMATDPVTSPIGKKGQILYGVSLGILTVVLRFMTVYPEGVLTSILMLNMLVPLFDKINAKSFINKKVFYFIFSSLTIILFVLSFYISNSIKSDNKKVSNAKIISLEIDKKKYLYEVESKGWGIIKAKIEVISGDINKIDILYSSDETHWDNIEKNNYINRLKSENIYELDTIAGSTVTTKALKDMIILVLEDYGEKYEK